MKKTCFTLSLLTLSFLHADAPSSLIERTIIIRNESAKPFYPVILFKVIYQDGSSKEKEKVGKAPLLPGEEKNLRLKGKTNSRGLLVNSIELISIGAGIEQEVTQEMSNHNTLTLKGTLTVE